MGYRRIPCIEEMSSGRTESPVRNDRSMPAWSNESQTKSAGLVLLPRRVEIGRWWCLRPSPNSVHTILGFRLNPRLGDRTHGIHGLEFPRGVPRTPPPIAFERRESSHRFESLRWRRSRASAGLRLCRLQGCLVWPANSPQDHLRGAACQARQARGTASLSGYFPKNRHAWSWELVKTPRDQGPHESRQNGESGGQVELDRAGRRLLAARQETVQW